MKQLANITCLFSMLGLAGLATAASPGDEQAAVSARVTSYLDAFNGRDIDACGEHWSENAEYAVLGSRERVQGREAIQKALQGLLETDEPFRMSVSEQKFRVISPHTVLEEGTATLVSGSHGVEQAQYLVVHVQQDGQWYRDSVREIAVEPSPADSSLRELDWLRGHWKHENDGGSMEIHGDWIHDRQFISRSFKVRSQDGSELVGTQMIGWDPSSGVIRSWTFDSQGGFQQGVWHRDGERWLVKVRAVLPDGSVGSEQRLLTREADGKLTIEVIEQQVEGQLLPSPEKVSLARASAAN